MILHPAVHQVIGKFEKVELHAARSGREVMHALAQMVADSTASDVSTLAAEVEAAVDALLAVLPAYAPPLNVLHLVMSHVEDAAASGAMVAELKASVAAGAESFRAWSEKAGTLVARYGAALIGEGATLFTFTLSETILRTVREAKAQGKAFKVLVTESRPNSDGLITAAELDRLGIAVSVSVDACMGTLIPQADLMIVGAEAIMADGSAICKVGTCPAAWVAHAHGVPVFVVVDTLKFNATSLLGLPLPLDRLGQGEIWPSAERKAVRIVGHLFDQTPARLITGIVTERGVLNTAACTTLMHAMPLSDRLGARLEPWVYRRQD